jgi:hypothetical protein
MLALAVPTKVRGNDVKARLGQRRPDPPPALSVGTEPVEQQELPTVVSVSADGQIYHGAR